VDDPIDSAPDAETAAAPRRSRTRLIALAIIVVLAGGGYAAWSVTQAQALAAARSAAAVDIETRWDAVEFSLGTIESATTRIGAMTGEDAEQTVASVLFALDSMETSAVAAIDAMDADVELLADGEARTAYAQSVSNARDAVSRAMKTKPSIAALPTFYTGSEKAAAALVRARRRVNSSIDAANSKKWASSVASAEKAIKDLKGAEAAMKSMRAAMDATGTITDTGDVAQGVRVVASFRRLADSALKVARIGRAHTSLSAYNAAIKGYNRAATASNKVEVPTFFASPILFATDALDSLRDTQDLVEAAKTYHEKALRASLATP